MTQWKKNILLLTVLNMHNKGSGWRFGVGVQNHRGSGGRESPSGIQGRSPGRGFMGTKSPRSWRILKVVISKFYAFLVVIHTQYMKSKHWLLKTKPTKHNSNPIVRQYELLSSSIWKKWVKQLGTPNVRSVAVVTTDLVIENDRPPDAGLPHPPPLTPLCPPSTAIVLHTDPLENDEQQAASCAFFHSREIENVLRESIASYPERIIKYSCIWSTP